MEQFAEYAHTLVSLAGFTLIVLILSPLSAARKESAGLEPGATPTDDYSSRAYRINRAYLNSVESLAPFVAVTMVAMLAGADAWWVNVLASVFFVSRIVVLFVHIGGFGRPHRGPRTFTYVIGWACMIGIAVIGIFAALSDVAA